MGTKQENMETRRVERRRWPWHVIAPIMLTLAVGAVLVVTGWQSLRPAIDVQVAPVLFINAGPEIPAQASETSETPARSSVTVQAPGWLEADPYITACTALADGVVQAIEVLEGEPVQHDQVVARLVPDDAAIALRRTEADVATAHTEVRLAEADLTAAQSDWDAPIERERAVATARATAAETEATLAQLPALIAAQEAMLAGMREEVARADAALQSGAATDIEVIILRKRMEAQEASLDALRDRETILQSQLDRERAELIAAERNYELRITERRTLDAASANLARAKSVHMQQLAALDEAKLRMERMVIRAPMTGLVQRRLKSPGDKVRLGMDDPHSAHIVHVYDPSKLQVRVDVPLADAAHVYIGQPCEVIVDVLPDTTFAGEVTRITNEADLQKNTLQIKVRVIDPAPVLRPEMLTRVKFLPSAKNRVSKSGVAAPQSSEDVAQVRVPQESLRDSGTGQFIWVVRNRRGTRGSTYPVDVQVASRHEGWARVSGALHTGDLVVLEPVDISPGTMVRMHRTAGPGETS